MPQPVPLPLSALEALATRYGTPFQLYDEASIRSNCRSLLTSFRQHFPSFQQYYAVKALPNPAILRLLLDEGCGLDCSSIAELHIAKALGVPGEKCMYTSNYTSKKDLGIAYDYGVTINLDDISLIKSLVEIRGKVPELLSFRLNPGLGRTDSETKSNVLGGPNAKFGVAPYQIIDAYREAKAAGATRFGIHMMTGSCVLNSAYWDDTVSLLLETVAKVHTELGITFEFINIGGGLGIPYRPNQEVVNVPELAKQLSVCVNTNWEKLGMREKGLNPPKLYMENGRYMTGPYGWLVSRCEVIKETWKKYYGLDSCMSNLMRPGMYDSYHYISVPAREGTSPRETANVVGTLCENNDWFAKDRDLPVSHVGDLFVIHDTGAHSHSMGFQYNGKLRAPELLLRSSNGKNNKENEEVKIDLIRERESISCLFDNTVLPNDLLPKNLSTPYPYHGRYTDSKDGHATSTVDTIGTIIQLTTGKARSTGSGGTGSSSNFGPTIGYLCAGIAVGTFAAAYIFQRK